MGVEEDNERIRAMEEASATLRMETDLANEAISRLRTVRKEVKYLLDTELPKVLAEAVEKGLVNKQDYRRVDL